MQLWGRSFQLLCMGYAHTFWSLQDSLLTWVLSHPYWNPWCLGLSYLQLIRLEHFQSFKVFFLIKTLCPVAIWSSIMIGSEYYNYSYIKCLHQIKHLLENPSKINSILITLYLLCHIICSYNCHFMKCYSILCRITLVLTFIVFVFLLRMCRHFCTKCFIQFGLWWKPCERRSSHCPIPHICEIQSQI